MKAERKGKSKKQVRLMQAAGAILVFFGPIFAIFVVDVLGLSSFLFVVITFVSILAGIVMILSTQESAVELEAQRLQGMPLTAIPDLGRRRVEATFQDRGYKNIAPKYLFKKHITVLKDAIYCCVRWAEADKVGEALEAILPEFGKVMDERPKWQRKNICLYLFLCVPALTAEDEAKVRELAASMRLFEETHLRGVARTVIPVLVDGETKTGYFLDQSKGIYVYDYGCRRLKKFFS